MWIIIGMVLLCLLLVGGIVIICCLLRDNEDDEKYEYLTNLNPRSQTMDIALDHVTYFSNNVCSKVCVGWVGGLGGADICEVFHSNCDNHNPHFARQIV